MLSSRFSLCFLLFIIGVAVADDMKKQMEEALKIAQEKCMEDGKFAVEDFDFEGDAGKPCAGVCVMKFLGLADENGRGVAPPGMPDSMQACMDKYQPDADCSQFNGITKNCLPKQMAL